MKTKTTKLMALVISVLMLATLLPAVAFAADEITVSNEAEMQNAIDNASGPTTIYITNDFTIIDITQFEIRNGKNITIKSTEGNNFTITPRLGYFHFYVGFDSILTLENITLDGYGVRDFSNRTGFGGVNNAGSLFIESGVNIINNFTPNWASAINNNRGTVTINGGSITGNTMGSSGGAIYNYQGIVNIFGGEICGNEAETPELNGGGIYNTNNGTVNIYGGVIENNSPNDIFNNSGNVNYFTNPCADGHNFIDDPGSVDYVAPTCTDAGFMPTKCSVCGEASGDGYVIPALGHSWNRGVVTVQPTAWSDGEKLFTCKTCGETYTIVLPKLTVNGVSANAFVEKLNGNMNSLTITVTEIVSKAGSEKQTEVTYTVTISISNNAAGTYQVGPYKVYVDTKGNTQIREIRIVE
ncbi:MAG: hypothetical protein FWG06_01345 [Clostridiales bacterium]|nr:hypothetical protein [Clostridiales bacterium]